MEKSELEKRKESEEEVKKKKEIAEKKSLEETIDAIRSLVCLPMVSKMAWTPHHRSLIKDFVEKESERILCCSILTPDGNTSFGSARLTVLLNLPLGNVSLVWYFIKINPKNQLNKKNIPFNLTYGIVETNNPTSVETFFRHVFQPFVMKNTPKEVPSAGPSSLSAILPQKRRKFLLPTTVLSNHRTFTNVNRLIYLLGAEMIHRINVVLNEPNLFVPEEALELCQRMKDVEKDFEVVSFLSNIEELLLHWVEQINFFVFQIGLRQSQTENGLLFQIHENQEKINILKNLTLICQSNSVNMLLTCLQDENSLFPVLFLHAFNDMKKFLETFEESQGRLSPLIPHLQNIYQDSTTPILDHAKQALKLLSQIRETMPHDFDRSRIENYFVMLSWDIVNSCKNQLDISSIFEDSLKEGQTTPSSLTVKFEDSSDDNSPLELILECCNSWEENYSSLYEKCFEKKAEDPETFPALPQSSSVLLPINLFKSRCEDLKFIWESKIQLSRYDSAGNCILSIRSAKALEDVGGTELDLLEEELSQVDKVLREALKSVQDRSKTVFQLTSKTWLRYFDQFRDSVEEIEQRYQCVMVSAVQTSETTSQGIGVINIFRPLKSRKSLYPVFFTMMDNVLDTLERNFENTERQFVFRALRVGPHRGFQFSKMAKWSSKTRNNLENSVKMIRSQTWLPHYARMDVVYERWLILSELLKENINKTYFAWTESLESNYTEKLRPPILRWKEGTQQLLQTNFDRSLKMELEEADTWSSLGFEVPNKISEIYADRKRYLNLISKVDSTVDKFNTIMKSISKDELRLFEIYIQLMVKSLYPALTSINWLMTEKIGTICDKGLTIVNITEKEVAEYLLENKKIQDKLYQLSSLYFYCKSTSNLYADSEFQDDILLQREKLMNEVKASFTMIEDALSFLHKKLVSAESSTSIQAFVQYAKKIDTLFINSLKEVLKRSFLNFEGVLISCRSRPSNYLSPVFLLSVNLTNKAIICSPELEVIQETIYNLKEVYEASLAEIPCLLRHFSSVDDKVHLHNEELGDEFCMEMQTKLNNEFDVQTKKLKATLEEWGEYRNLWEIEVSEFFENYLFAEPDIQSFVNDIALLENKFKKLNDCPDEINCGMFRLDFQMLIKALKEKCLIWKEEFLIQFYKVSKYKLENLGCFLENTQNLLKQVPSDLKEIFSLKEVVASRKELLKQQTAEFDLIYKMFRIIANYEFPVDECDEIRLTYLRDLNSQLENEISVHQICLSDKQEDHRKHYIVKSEEIFQKTEEIKIFYKMMLPTKSDVLPQNAISRIDTLLKNIEEVRSSFDINKELEILNLPPIHFDELDTYERHAIHLRKIWILFDEWHQVWNSWSKLLIWDINSVEFQELLMTFEKRLKEFLLSYSEPYNTNQISIEKLVKYEIEERLLRSIENCKELTPLIINFQSAKLESHHWNKIKEVVKADFDEHSPSFSLQHFLNLNFIFYQQEINMIIVEAAEEMRFMESLKKIETSANEIHIQTKYIPYVGSILIHSFENTKEKIKEISIKIDVLSSSPYSVHYSSIIKSNRDLLKSMLSLLENLNDFQNLWVKWQTFFNAQDVREYFINLSTIFDLLTKVWKDISSMIANEIYLTKILKGNDPTKQLKEMLQELQLLFPIVEDYLFDKCLSYGRFCFLSLDDVIGTLSKVYDGESARPYLKKMFMNIDKTKQLKNSNLNCMEIIGIYSEEGEFLELNPYVSVTGEFHSWCSKLEKSIECTLRNDVKQCRSALKSGGSKVDETLKVWPLQACIVAHMINFSLDVSKAFSKEGVPKKLLKKVSDTSQRITSVMQENVPKILLEKLRLFLLIVLQAKDLIDVLLRSPESRDNFLYYHWDRETENTTVNIKPYTFEYSWEYQGLWKTIVTTPNYYQMIFNVSTFLARGYNIGVIGAEGEGKSEMIKSFGYYLGRNVKSVVTLDRLKLSSLFLLLLGAYQTHTWLLFEKAVRVPLPFLSVLEDLIIKPCQKNIDFAVNKVNLNNFEIDVEGITMKQNSLAAVFLELDKNDATSRHVLETLAETLRPIAFIPPPRKILIECLLAQTGIHMSEGTPEKLSTFLQALSHSMPSTCSNLFGLHSLKRIIRIIEALSKDFDESQLSDVLPKALKLFYVPQLESPYSEMFDDVFEMIFPDFESTPLCNENILEYITMEINNDDCYTDNAYLMEISNLYRVISDYRMIYIEGSFNSGKSKAIVLLSKAITRLSSEEPTNYKPVICEFVCPQSTTKCNIFNAAKSIENNKWEGFLLKILQSFSSSSSSDVWIVFKSFGASTWIAKFLSRFQDENIYLTNDNEFLLLPSHIKFIFDLTITDVLENQLHLKNIPTFCFKTTFIWKNFLLYEMKRKLGEVFSATIQTLVDSHLSKFIEILGLSTENESQLILKSKAFVAILSYFEKNLKFTNENPKNLEIFLIPTFVFGIVWTFGAQASLTVRDQVTDLVTRLIDSLPSQKSAYDLSVNINDGSFCLWNEFIFKCYKREVHGCSEDLFKFIFLSNIFAENNIPVLLEGPKGSGKTKILNFIFQNQIYDQKIIKLVNYDATFSNSFLNHLIKTSFGDNDKKFSNEITVLIDNLDCYETEDQLHDTLSYMKYINGQHQVFDEELNEYYKISKINWICSFTTEEDVVNKDELEDASKVTLSNFFHILKLPPFNIHSFSFMFRHLYVSYLEELEQDVNSMKSVIEESLNYVYFECKKRRGPFDVLETPNLIERFMKGISICNQGYLDREGFIKLFIHELWRTFYDSGIFVEDTMKSICADVVNNYFCLSENILEDDPHNVVYTQLKSDDYTYSSETISKITKQLKFLNKNNDLHKNIILFSGFTRHFTNIIRVIGLNIHEESVKSIGDNILLIGPGGTGKKTCLRYAAKLSNLQLLELEGNERDQTKLQEEIFSKDERNVPIMILIDLKRINKMQYISIVNNIQMKYAEKFGEKAILKIILAVCVRSKIEIENFRLYLPSFFHSFVADNYFHWSTTDFQEITNEIFEVLPSDCSSYINIGEGKLFEVLLKIHNSFPENEFPPSKYFLFVSLVLKFIKESINKNKEKQTYLQVNIEKYDETTVLVKELSRQLGIQRTEVSHIQQTCGNTILKMRNIKSEQGRLEQELHKKSTLLSRQKEESLRIRELIDRDLTKPREKMHGIHKELIRVTKEDFDAIKNSLRPLPEVEEIFGIIMVLLGMESSWNEVKKQLVNSLDFVVKVRKISVENVSSKAISYAEEHLPTNFEISDDKFPAAAIVFYRWIKYFLVYAQLYKDYYPLKLQADSIDKDMDETISTIKTYQYDLASFSVQHKVLLSQLEEREKCLEQAEEKMKLLERKIQLAQSVMEQLSGDKSVWIKSQEKLRLDEKNHLGNSILKSAIVTYLGFYTFDERRIYFEKCNTLMKENCLYFNEEMSMAKLIINLRSKVEWQRKGLKINDVCLESLAILSESPLHQIVLDPLMILKTYFEESDEYEEIELSANDFYERILYSTKYGKKCYIQIYDNVIPFFLQKLINESSSKSDEKLVRQTTIEGKTVEISSTFKLVIHFLSSQMDFDSSDFKPVANIVNLRAEETMLQNLIAYKMFETSEKESMEMYLKNQKELVEKRDKITEHELSIQDLLSRFHEALSEESPLLESLQNMSATVTTFRQECFNIQEAMKETENKMKSYESTALKLAQLYLLFSKLSSIVQRTILDFERFLTLAVDEMLVKKGQLRWGTLLESNTLILSGQGIYRFLQKEESGSLLITSGLLIATWYESQLGSATKKLIKILFSHECQNRTFVQRNPLKQWLPDERYSMLLNLIDCHPYQELLNHMETNSNLWRDWCFNEQPENAALPKQMDRIIRGISRLILIKILRPDRFSEVSQNYIEKVLRQPKKLPDITTTLINTASNCPPNEIIILKSLRLLQVENILKKILPVCYPVLTSNPNAIQVLNLTNEGQEYLRYILRDCAHKGYWLLLKYKHENKESGYLVASELEKLFNEGLNKRFRLWIYVTSDDIFSNLFFNYQTILLPLPTLLKESLEYVFELTGENIISNYTNNAKKHHFVCLALLHIGIENRQNLFYDICNFSQQISESHWYEAEVILRECLSEFYSANLNIEHLVSSFYASGSLTENISNTIKTLVSCYISPERVASIFDKIPALTHYSVPHSNDMANHLSQLEFIYKAPSAFLTFTSRTLYEYQEINACRKIEDLLSNISMEEICTRSFQRQFLRLEILKKNLFCFNPNDTSILYLFMRLERIYLLQVIKQLFKSRASVSTALDRLNKCLAGSIRDHGISCPNRLLKSKINLIIERSNYMLGINSQESLMQNLILGYFKNPLCIWSFITHKVWFENICEEAISFHLVQQSELQNEVSNAGAEVLIKNLYLLGCHWDFQEQKLKSEDNSYMNPLMTKFNLAVVPLSENMRMMIKEIRAFKTPVFSDFSSTTPLFWIYLQLDEGLDEESLILRGVRILLQ